MKSSTKWFLVIMALLLFIGVGVAMFFYILIWSVANSDEAEVTRVGSGEKIALVELTGVITSSEETVRQIKKFREDKSIKGILLRVDSPGGGVVASQEIYEEVKRTRDEGKPIVVSMGSLAASGGYYVSCAASRIVANPGTLTGSIGVISQFMHFDSLFGKIGIGVNTIKSGKLKDAGNPFRAMTPEDRAYFQKLMDEVHAQFISAVEENRDLDHDTVAAYADGRVFTGAQAAEMGFVDTLGTYEDAIRIAAHMAGIKGTPSIVKERKRGRTFFDLLFGRSSVEDLLNFKDELLNQPILQYKLGTSY